MVTVIPAALSEGLLVRDIRAGIEHAGVSTIVRDPVTLQICDVPGEWSGGCYCFGVPRGPSSAPDANGKDATVRAPRRAPGQSPRDANRPWRERGCCRHVPPSVR